MASGAAFTALPSPANLPAQQLTWHHAALRPVLRMGVEREASRRSKSAIGSLPSSNYVVPLDKAGVGIIRPLGEILRDLNKKVSGNVVSKEDRSIPWYHANRLLSFYAPGWCGEIRNVIFSEDGTVTVVYRVTVRGIDGEAHRESTGTVPVDDDGKEGDAVNRAEQIAFCRACARFGLGLYLYHEDDTL